MQRKKDAASTPTVHVQGPPYSLLHSFRYLTPQRTNYSCYMHAVGELTQRTDVASTPGGFPLNISPLPTVQNSSKIIHSQNQFTHTIFTKVFYLKNLSLLI